MSIKETIRAEIERRFSEYNCDSNHHIQAAECASILSFLDTLKEEPDKSLKEAAEEYGHNTFINDCMENGVCDSNDLSDAFIAGAKRQANHTPLPEDTVLFQKGVEEGKRLMMEDAVECSVYAGKEGGKWIVSYIGNYESMLKTCRCGDKVRIIVCKKED